VLNDAASSIARVAVLRAVPIQVGLHLGRMRHDEPTYIIPWLV
jgi:hypothetical protein